MNPIRKFLSVSLSPTPFLCPYLSLFSPLPGSIALAVAPVLARSVSFLPRQEGTGCEKCGSRNKECISHKFNKFSGLGVREW